MDFVDHTKYSVWRQQQLGYTAAKAMYPLDNTHTDATGAKRKSLRCSLTTA